MHLDPADLALIDTFARRTGLPASLLVQLSVQALAQHLRQHGQITLPLTFTPAAPARKSP